MGSYGEQINCACFILALEWFENVRRLGEEKNYRRVHFSVAFLTLTSIKTAPICTFTNENWSKIVHHDHLRWPKKVEWFDIRFAE